MRHRSTSLGLLFVVGAGLATGAGCGEEHCGERRAMVDAVEGSMVYLEGAITALERQELETSCHAKYPSAPAEPPNGAQVGSGGRWTVPWGNSAIEYPARERCAGGGAGCMVLYAYSPLDVYLRWQLPATPGDYPLSDLGAEICEPYPDPVTDACGFTDEKVPHCVPVAGRLAVHAVGPVCQTGACTILDADLTLEGNTDPATSEAASARGSAHLSLVFEDYGYACHRAATKLK